MGIQAKMQVLWDMRFTYYAFMTTRTQAQIYPVTSVTYHKLYSKLLQFVLFHFALQNQGLLHSIQGFKHNSGLVSVAQ